MFVCEQVMEELKGLMVAYEKELGYVPEMLGLALSARKNLCIHPEVRWASGSVEPILWTLSALQVSREETGKELDNKCHKLTASFQRQRHRKDNRVPVCSFFEVSCHRTAILGHVLWGLAVAGF